MSTQPFVSVIVPVLDDQERLDRCLAALERQTYPADRFEVIVVDNGSRPPVSVADGRARVFVDTRPGSYAARNRGVEAARGDILAFTDADCRPEADWLERGVAALLANPTCGLVAGAIVLFCRDSRNPTAAEVYDILQSFDQHRFVTENHFGATANVFTTRDVIERVGGFDSSLLSAGDVDFGGRVHAAGYRLAYAADARVWHPARSSMRQLLKKVVRTEVGLKSLARARGRRYPEVWQFPLLVRLLYIPVAMTLGWEGLSGVARAKGAMAMAAVEIVRAGTRAMFDRGVELDLRRFWGT